MPRISPLKGVFLLLAAVAAVLMLGAGPAFAVPYNDDFPGTAFSTIPYEESLDTTGATVEVDEPISDCGPLDATVWWAFTAPESATYIVEVTSDGSFAPLFAVWQESTFPGGGLVDVACAGIPQFPGEPLEAEARANFPGQAGKTYYIQAGGFGFFGTFPDDGPITFRMSRAAPPANDAFGSAIIIDALPFDHDVDFTGATTEPKEPQSPCVNDPGRLGIQFGTTVWYVYTPEADGYVLVDLLASDAYPTAVVWAGQPGNLTEVACGSFLGFAVQAGQTYYLQIGEVYDAFYPLIGGVVSLHVEHFVIPECPAETQHFSDPPEDTFGLDEAASSDAGVSADVVGVRAASDSEAACLTLQFSEALPVFDGSGDTFVFFVLYLDADSSQSTGGLIEPDPEFICGAQGPLGADVLMFGANDGNLVVPLYEIGGFESVPLGGTGVTYAVVTLAGDAITVAMPSGVIGGDGSFDFVGIALSGQDGDCLPDEGVFGVVGPTQRPFGDLDCSGSVTTRDNQALMRGILNQPLLSQTEPCPNVGADVSIDDTPRIFGDVDCDGEITSRDNQAELRDVLQQNALSQMEPCPDIGTGVTIGGISAPAAAERDEPQAKTGERTFIGAAWMEWVVRGPASSAPCWKSPAAAQIQRGIFDSDCPR